MNLQGTLIGGLALAAIAGWGGAQVQKGFDHAECDRKIQDVRKASIKAINDQLQINLVLRAERDQAKAEVDKVNATTMAQFKALEEMLADDRVKREEASARIEVAAKEAAKNARTASERAQAARDAGSQDRCAIADIPDDILRMLDGIGDPGTRSARLVDGSMPPAKSRDR